MSIEGRNNPAMEMLGNRDAALKLAAENPLLAGDPVTQDFLFKGGVVNGKEEDMGETQDFTGVQAAQCPRKCNKPGD
jgi:hypothetical protein